MVRAVDRVSGFLDGREGAGMKKCAALSATVWAASVSSSAAQLPRFFVRKPVALSLDLSISSDACRLYDILAVENYRENFGTNLVTISVRGVAVLLQKSPSTISRWLKQLTKAGHLEKLSGRGARSAYRLNSEVFQHRAAVQSRAGEVRMVDGRDLPAVRARRKQECPRCQKRAHITSTSGVCDECLAAWGRKLA
jgi:Fe2+ or Zn2+ uptake regulation protein